MKKLLFIILFILVSVEGKSQELNLKITRFDLNYDYSTVQKYYGWSKPMKVCNKYNRITSKTIDLEPRKIPGIIEYSEFKKTSKTMNLKHYDK